MMSHPLTTTLTRLGALAEWAVIRADLPDEPGWHRLDALLDPGEAAFDARLALAQAHYPSVARKVLVGNLFDRIAWWALVAALAPLLAEQRVPEIAPNSIALRFHDEGYVDGLALAPGRFAALPDDVGAEHCDALIVPGTPALWIHFYRQLEAPWLPMLIDAARRRAPLSEKALWLSVADSCARLVLWLNQRLGRQEACAGEVRALLARLPHRGTTGILPVELNGRRELFVRRSTCCFAYTYPEHGYCSTCPKRRPTERLQLLQEYLSKQEDAA